MGQIPVRWRGLTPVDSRRQTNVGTPAIPPVVIEDKKCPSKRILDTKWRLCSPLASTKRKLYRGVDEGIRNEKARDSRPVPFYSRCGQEEAAGCTSYIAGLEA